MTESHTGVASAAAATSSVDDDDDKSHDANLVRHTASFERRLRTRAHIIVSEADKYMHKHHLTPASDWDDELRNPIVATRSRSSSCGEGEALIYANTSDLSVVSFETVESFDVNNDEKAFVIVDDFPMGATSSSRGSGVEESPDHPKSEICARRHTAEPKSQKYLTRKMECDDDKYHDQQSLVIHHETKPPVIGVPAYVVKTAQPWYTPSSLQPQPQQQQQLMRPQQQLPQTFALRPSMQFIDQSSYDFGKKQCVRLVCYAVSTLTSLFDDYCYKKCKNYFLVNNNNSKRTTGNNGGVVGEMEFELADMQTETREEAQHNRLLLRKED